MIHNSDGEIRKLIDPKSGFTLYVRKFDDAAISQVSTVRLIQHHNQCLTETIS